MGKSRQVLVLAAISAANVLLSKFNLNEILDTVHAVDSGAVNDQVDSGAVGSLARSRVLPEKKPGKQKPRR